MRIAVTGAASFLGARLLRRLAEERGPDNVVAVDLAAPPANLAVRARTVDLTEPASDQRLLEVFGEEGVETVVHAASFTNPRRDGSYAHELESIGTLSVLAAAEAAAVRHVVMRSSTAVYGARGQHPALLTEDVPLEKSAPLGWLREKREAEAHAALFAKRGALAVTVVRLAPLFGPAVHTFYTRVFDRRVVPVLLGYDPLVQLLHPEDALEGLMAAVRAGKPGAFNVVPRRPITLLAALHLADKLPVAVPHPMAYAAVDLLWSTGVGQAPAGFLDFVRYPLVADGTKAARELGFEPRFSSKESLLAYVAYRYGAGAAA
jgi:UDP-glucose 4-epimerase